MIALHDYFSGVRGESLQSLIRFMYAGNLFLNSENVRFMLQTATQLMVKPAINLCQRFLSENENLFEVDGISSVATEKLENNLDQVIIRVMLIDRHVINDPLHMCLIVYWVVHWTVDREVGC